MNYSYKTFLSVARVSLERSLSKARSVLDSLSMTMALDNGFPWTGPFRDAVGRCGRYTEYVNFDISIHMRSIYACIREDMLNSWFDSALDWEREIMRAVDDTVFHEIAHGIFGVLTDYSYEDDNFWDWCIANGFDKTVFVSNVSVEVEEDLCEEYARSRENSRLGKLITAYASWEEQ